MMNGAEHAEAPFQIDTKLTIMKEIDSKNCWSSVLFSFLPLDWSVFQNYNTVQWAYSVP